MVKLGILSQWNIVDCVFLVIFLLLITRLKKKVISHVSEKKMEAYKERGGAIYPNKKDGSLR
jgi:hypothetical protein